MTTHRVVLGLLDGELWRSLRRGVQVSLIAMTGSVSRWRKGLVGYSGT